jgi:hypothetical protein
LSRQASVLGFKSSSVTRSLPPLLLAAGNDYAYEMPPQLATCHFVFSVFIYNFIFC